MSVRGFLVFAVLLAGGCRPDQPEVMAPDVFVGVMIDLREALRDSVDAVGFAARRDSILLAAGVTDSMLIEFARRHGRDATYMAALWDSVDQVVNEVKQDSLMGLDTARVP